MQLAITTDFVRDTGNPAPALQQIAQAGFSHIHWCHQWCTDFLYSRFEIEQIGRWLTEYGLQLLDLHGSAGVEKNWVSLREYERLAGVELVKNRIEMTGDLGGGVVIMHTGPVPHGQEQAFWSQLRRSLDELEPLARTRGVRIAVENGEWSTLTKLLPAYAPEYLGVCYDSGHGNLGKGSPADLAQIKNRLISVHLHDNDGQADQHKLPFTGTVPWPHLASILAGSSYARCVSLEVIMRNSGIAEEESFLTQAYAAGCRLTQMIENSVASGNGN